MNTVRALLSIVCLTLLVACGGGGGDDAASTTPGQAGSADVGPSGGTVSAVFEGGATVTLTVPPGALTTTTTIRIDPSTAPADALGAMTLSPAGLQFKIPATLSVTLPASMSPSGTLVTFDIGGTRVPIGSVDGTSRTMTADLPYLGVGSALPRPSAAADRARAQLATQATTAANTTLQLLVQRGNLNQAAAMWHQLVNTLAADGSVENAINVQVGFAALLTITLNQADQAVKDQIASDITTWRNIDCRQLESSINALNAFSFASDFAGYALRATDVLVWGKLMQDVKPLTDQLAFINVLACPSLSSDISAPVRPSFPNYISAARAGLAQLVPQADFDLLLNTRLRQLVSFDAALRQLGGVDDLAAQVATLAAEQTSRLRQAAYDDCRLNRSQARQRTLLLKEAGDPGFEAISLYEQADLLADIELCGMVINWELRDAQGQVLNSGVAGGGASAGAATPTVTVPMAGADKLVIKGPLSALRCSVGSANNEQLTFSAGPLGGTVAALPSLTPANDGGYLEASNLELSVAQLKTMAQPTGTGNGELDIARQGEFCNGEFFNLTRHRQLVKFELAFAAVQIDTAALPAGRVGTAYAQTLAASGATAPYTWSASGLPPGLTVQPSTGVLSGTPTASGTSSVTLTATSADGAVGQRTLSLTIEVAATAYSGTILERVDQPGFTSCSNGVCTTSTRSDLNTYVVRLELQPDNSFVASGTITVRSRAQQSSDDGCSSAQSVDESGRVTGFTGELLLSLPKPVVGILSGPVAGTRTDSATACPRQGGFSVTTSTSHEADLNLKLDVFYEFSGSTLTAIVYQHQVFDSTSGTTFSTTGRLTLGP